MSIFIIGIAIGLLVSVAFMLYEIMHAAELPQDKDILDI